MFSRIRVEVKDRKQAKAITLALRRDDVRAFVITVGTLEQLPSDRARERILRFVTEHFEDPDNQPAG